MVNGATIRNVVGIIGNVISFGLFFAPVPTFWRIIKKKSVEEFQPYPYIATFMNCMLWVFYGLPIVHPNSILVTTINAVGLGFETIYLIIFFIYSSKAQRTQISIWIPVEIVFTGIIVVVTLFVLRSTFAKMTFVGVICDVFNIIMYASPTLAVKKVVQTRSVEYMPFWISFFGFLNACIWTAYSLIHTLDLYVLISNGLGTLCGASQLIVYAMYFRRTPIAEGENDIKKRSEVHISGPNVV